MRVRRGTLALALSLAACWTGVFARSSQAATREASCGDLQQTIEEVAHGSGHGAGETITLDGLCDATALKSGAGVTLPAGSSISLEGKPGTASGFDGAAVNAPLLSTKAGEPAMDVTLSDLVFEHASLTGASALSLQAARATLTDDRFLENELQGGSAHGAFVSVGQPASSCPTTSESPTLVVSDSTFKGNRLALGAVPGGGAGALLEDECSLGRNLIEGNAFEENTLEAAGTPEGAEVTGAGLRFLGASSAAVTVTQSANVFDSNNLIAAAPALANYGGGGEWLQNADLTSVADRYSRNTIAGTASPSNERWSWGAGLGIDDLPLNCSATGNAESTLEDSVLTGNSIGPGDEEDLGGGGAWVGCVDLRVLDSSFTLNSSPYGAGIEGEPEDGLELENSIVAGDNGRKEIDGFYQAPGSLRSSYSDVCASSESSEALPGVGDICAAPRLENEGNPSSFDVHETQASPTIDAGSNALVPQALEEDFYGAPRVLAARAYLPACTAPATWVAFQLDPPTVDMGAAEYGPIAVPALALACPPIPNGPSSTTTQPPSTSAMAPGSTKPPTVPSPSIIRRAHGKLVLAFTGLSTGRIQVVAKFTGRLRVAHGHGDRHAKSHTKTLEYGQVAKQLTKPGAAKLLLTPTKAALAALARAKRLRLKLSIEFTPLSAGHLDASETVAHTRTITVLFGA